jgi:hypothetical protein
MTRSDTSAETVAPQRLFRVQQAGDRWLVVRRLAGLDGSAAVVADCLTRSAAERVAEDLNAREAA